MASFFEGRPSIMERSTLHAATGNEGEEIDAAIDASEEMAHMLEALQAAKAGASVMDASEEEKEEKREEEDIVGEQESRLSATIPPPPPSTTDAAAVEDSNTNTDEKEEQPASATVDATKTSADSADAAAAAAADSAADTAAPATSSASKKKKRTEAEMYDAFERLYMHHTVASLAHRIDFDVSMLDNRKEFRAPRRHSISGPREVSGSEWAASPLPTRPKAPASAKHSTTTSSSNKRPPRPFSNRNSQKNKQSIARMIAATKPAAAGRETASAHSASTAEMENTSQKKSPELSKKSFKKNSLTVETKSDVVPTGDLVGAMSTDTEDDMLQDILNPGVGLAEPGTFGLGDDQEGEVVFDATGDDDEDDDAKSGDDVETSQDLAAQEAAMVQALEQAVQEFETAAAVSDNKEPTERGDEDVSDLLDVAAKNVASAAEET